MAIVKIRELIGTSTKNFEDAMQNIVNHEVEAGKNVTGVHVINQTAEVKEGKIFEFKVNAKVAYKWEK
ncbi:MAG: dodecin family protein [Candidatus Portnoybacteria bacterium]|nr:dodecin family protein [Candidatus Portnoybacteria bacterium]MDD4982783.1 dodecin family protein [Candidatus Portnoybacteria bacterium]